MDQTAAPHLIVLAGPNGAGKSTAAPKLLPQLLGVGEFVNADVIAHGLSAFRPEKQAIEAGRIMLRRLRALAAARESFAFETTLASRSFAPWIKGLVESGYQFDLAFFFLADAGMAVNRVAQRVRSGGHHVPEDVIRRRYERGLRNLVDLYIPLASTWRVYDNSLNGVPRRIASGGLNRAMDVADVSLWQRISETRGAADEASED